jgi:hypothetical protein
LGPHVARLAGEKLALAVELGETCGTRNYPKSPAWVTAYDYVSGRAGNTSQRRQRVCAEYAAQESTAWSSLARRAAQPTGTAATSQRPAGDRT